MEALVAGVALVGLVSLVTPGVGLKVGQLGEGLRAACKETNDQLKNVYVCTVYRKNRFEHSISNEKDFK